MMNEGLILGKKINEERNQLKQKVKFLIYSFQVFRHDLDLLKKLSEQGRLRYVLYDL